MYSIQPPKIDINTMFKETPNPISDPPIEQIIT